MTRETILRSAKKLMGSRQNVTLEDVADEAEISRATVYRYFSNIDLLLAEASLDIHHLSPKEILDQIRSRPATERLTFTQKYYNGLALEHELIFRDI